MFQSKHFNTGFFFGLLLHGEFDGYHVNKSSLKEVEGIMNCKVDHIEVLFEESEKCVSVAQQDASVKSTATEGDTVVSS